MNKLKHKGALRHQLDKVRTAPNEFLIFPFGRIDFTKELHKHSAVFTKSGGEEILKTLGGRTADLEIDYEHDSTKPGTGPKPAAGWFNVELRDDGLWAVNVRWTAAAKQMLEAGEYRYFSPVFWTLKDTKEILALESMALTNNPAFDHLQALVAASKDASPEGAPAMDFHKKLSAHLTKKAMAPKDAASKLGVDENRLRKLCSGDEKPTQEEMDKCSKLDGWDDGDADDKTEKKDEASSLDGASPDETTEGKDEAKPAAIAKAAASRDAVLEKVLGTKDPLKQAGILKGLFDKATQYDRDHADVVALKKDAMDKKRAELIEAGKAAGKLTPSLIKHFATRDVAELEGFLEVAPKVFDPGGSFHEPDPKSPASKLSAEQVECCRMMGISEEALVKSIEENASGAAQQKILATYRTR